MILTNHILTGSVILLKVKCLPLALVLAFLSHYLLDILPHNEYSIENIKKRNWKKSRKGFLKIFPDICIGFLIVFFLSKNVFLAMLGGLVAILPDLLTFLYLAFPNKLLEILTKIHAKTHFWKNKKIPLRLETFNDALIFFLALYFLIN